MLELRRAEEQATADVEKARKDKSARLKQAKNEAEKEIAQFKLEQEQKFKQAEDAENAKESAGFSVTSQQKETDAQVAKMTADVQAGAGKIAELMLEVVMKVDMRIPEARKGVRAG
ncbi:hypothetical protein BASA81_003779 [Batrachochytrium salamandrivorans]|nr:hypothetical protein BASA81_003779 [Batrachochytrium salamandrivorans]